MTASWLDARRRQGCRGCEPEQAKRSAALRMVNKPLPSLFSVASGPCEALSRMAGKQRGQGVEKQTPCTLKLRVDGTYINASGVRGRTSNGHPPDTLAGHAQNTIEQAITQQNFDCASRRSGIVWCHDRIFRHLRRLRSQLHRQLPC